MKKISFYIMALLTAVFAACDDDYSVSTPPQSNPQESILQSSDITFNGVEVGSINLQNLIESDAPIVLGNVSVVDGAMPANTVMKARVDIAKAADFSDAYTLECESMDSSSAVSVLPSNLQAAYYNHFTHNPNQATLYLRINLFTVTDDTSEAIIGTPGSNYYGNYQVPFTPVNERGIYISKGYYAVVKGLDGKWKETKFNHSDTDVYDDPEFSVTIDALKNDADVRLDTEYMIVAEEDLAKFQAGDKSVAFGKGEGEGMLKGGPAFVGPANDGAVIIPFLIANHLYGPSYVSMHTALRHYGLIPERVYLTQSMTIKHSRSFDTPIGRFSYYSCPTNYFPIGIQQESQEGVTYLVATPEKALCDLIIKSPGMNATTVKSLRSWLADDLRFDMEAFNQFNKEIMVRCALQAPAKNNVLSLLIKLINHE